MANIEKESFKFLCQGFALGVVDDLRPPNKYKFLQNIRVIEEGVLESRALVEQFLTLNPDPNAIPHSIRTILNKSNNSFLRIVGVGTKLYTGNGLELIEKDSGFSGKALFMIDFRPEQSIEAYLYIADENKFVKVSVSNILSDVGITAPNKAATWSIGAPEKKIIDKISTGSDIDWNNLTGSATAPTIETRVDTTIIEYLEDGALPNFVSIVPDDSTNIQKGSIVTINGIDKIVEEVIPSGLSIGQAIISNISYDFGNSGPATIVLSVPGAEIIKNSILKLNNIEYIRVDEVTRDSNNIPSIRTSTIGTFVTGQTIEGFAAFRVYTDVGFAIGQTIVNNSIKTNINAGGVSSITRIFDVDLLNTGSKPLTLEDVFHISLLADSSKINEIQIQLALDDSNFTGNWVYFPISPNFFTGSVNQTTTILPTLQGALDRERLLEQTRNIYGRVLRFADSGGYDPGVDFEDIYRRLSEDSGSGLTTETVTGQLQWTELDIHLADFLSHRVGSDLTKTLKDIKAIRISINAKEATDVFIDSIWVGGSAPLNNAQSGLLAYNYVWRIRDPNTKATSNWSPPLRSGIKISRGFIELSFPDANVTYPIDYRIDVARFGGTVSEFRIVGAIKNDGSKFIDTSSDRLVQDNSLAGRFAEHGAIDAIFDFYKPFAILDAPKKGTCDIVGTKFTRKTGDSLSITYPRGTQIVINGSANKFYTNPIDTDNVELEKDMGNLINVEFEIQDPLLTGQPLPVIFGPTGEGFLGLFIFGIGDKNNAGTVYWLDGNSPDTMSDTNRLEITPPSEPLVTGIIYDGFPYLYSIARGFVLQPTISSEGDFSFIARETANSRGVFCRTSICISPNYIFFLSENADGIYRVQGNGNPQSITDGILANLFYTDDKIPIPVKLIDGTIINPPNFLLKDEIRFFSTNKNTIFRFIDIEDKQVALIYSNKLNDFISYDVYKNNKINAFYHEELESSTDILVGIESSIGKFGAGIDYEDDVISKVIPFSYDAGDSRFIKEFKELIIDANPGQEGLSITNYYNNGSNSDPTTNIAGLLAPIRNQEIIDLQDNNGVGKRVKNITSIFEWLLKSGTKLYEEKIYFIPKGDTLEDRSSDIEDGGDSFEKLWQGVVIKADTFGEDKILNYLDDENILRASIIINHNGERTVSYPFQNPFISHTIKRISDDEVLWIPNSEVYIFDREPEEAEVWEGEFNTHDLSGLILFHRFGIAYRSTGDSILKLIFEDGIEQIYENKLPNSNGEYNKEFFYAIPRKWKACKYRFESEGKLRLYKRDSEVWMKAVNSNETFRRFAAFGGSSRESEILI